MASDSDSLTAVIVGNSEDPGCRSALIANSEGTRGVEVLKAIRKVVERWASFKITIDGPGENGVYDRL
jgi:hypothetical protein